MVGSDIDGAKSQTFKGEWFTVAALRELSQVKQTLKECGEMFQVLLTVGGFRKGTVLELEVGLQRVALAFQGGCKLGSVLEEASVCVSVADF